MKIKDLGEFGLIERISTRFKRKDVLIGMGDDCAAVKTKGIDLYTTDALVEDVHFNMHWMSPLEVGKKAIEVNVSDIAAMGGVPKHVLVSLVLPDDLEVKWVDKLYEGMRKVCDRYKIGIIGGNMAKGEKIVINITLVGSVDEQHLIKRSGAKPGDFIMVSGKLGGRHAGLRAWQEKMQGHKKAKDFYKEPKAKLSLARQLALKVNAMIDISDGVASDVGHICKASRVGAIIYKDELPVSDHAMEVAKSLDEDPEDYALYGGEEYELLFTVPRKLLGKIDGFMIGEITKDKKILLSHSNKKEELKPEGFNHFG